MVIKSNKVAFQPEMITGGKILDILSKIANGLGSYLESKSKSGMKISKAIKREDGSTELNVDVTSVRGKKLDTESGSYSFSFVFTPTSKDGKIGDVTLHWDAQEGIQAGNATRKDVKNTEEAVFEVLDEFTYKLFGEHVVKDEADIEDAESFYKNAAKDSSVTLSRKFSIKLKKITASENLTVCDLDTNNCCLTSDEILDSVESILSDPSVYEDCCNGYTCYDILVDDDCVNCVPIEDYEDVPVTQHLYPILTALYRFSVICEDIRFNAYGTDLNVIQTSVMDCKWLIDEQLEIFNRLYRRFADVAPNPLTIYKELELDCVPNSYDLFAGYTKLIEAIQYVIDVLTVESYSLEDDIDIYNYVVNSLNALSTKKDYINMYLNN